ncbi:MAG: hypothetical protein ACT4OI_07475 [Methanobacteriota archaeon]
MTNRKLTPLAWLGIGLVVTVIAMAVFGALSTSASGGYYGMMGAGWGWGMAFMAVPLIVLVLVLVFAVGGLWQTPAPATYPAYVPAPTSALEALDQRYARGEIGRDEYVRTRADLTQH